jgi:hypothetical protein
MYNSPSDKKKTIKVNHLYYYNSNQPVLAETGRLHFF